MTIVEKNWKYFLAINCIITKIEINNISKFVKYYYIYAIILFNVIFEYIYFNDDV